MREIVFILEPDTGRVTVESSQADAKIAKEINKDLGQGSVVNCARPKLEIEKSLVKTVIEGEAIAMEQKPTIFVNAVIRYLKL